VKNDCLIGSTGIIEIDALLCMCLSVVGIVLCLSVGMCDKLELMQLFDLEVLLFSVIVV
jgi:hypothetical protein